jgi:heavy metal sensor kinase
MNVRSFRFRLTAWYVGLVAALLVLSGVFVYVELKRFLEANLREALSKESQTIGEALLREVDKTGEDYVVHEMEEHFAPRITGRFLRVTRSDGSLLYQSSPPQDHAFEPSQIPKVSLTEPSQWREERASSGSPLLLYSMPFQSQSGNSYLIQAGAPYEQVERVLRQLLISFGVAFPLIVGVAVAGGYLLLNRATRPLNQIADTAERITSRNLNERLPTPATGDELEKLAVSLNRMMGRLEEAFHHINRFSADASHEIRTPLAILRGELEHVIQSTGLPRDTRESLGSALEETERLSKIVEQLLEMSRLEAGETLSGRTRFDFAELTRTTVDQMRLLAEEKNLTLRFEGNQCLEIDGDNIRVRQVVVNLIDNAIKYTPARGSITVTSFRHDARAIVEVADTGIGIPAEAASHIFERFYRVDKARSRQMGGTGLGLAIAKSICLAHGGGVTLKSTSGEGTVFRVELPLDLP